MICYLKNKSHVNRVMLEEDVECFYLAQNYFKLPRQTIRENAKFICFHMTWGTLPTLSMIMWEKQNGFVIIDLSSKKHDGKYRSGLDEFYIPN